MNCQDISRALDSRDVNAISEAERRAFDAHATSCSHCAPGWIVYTRLAAIPAPSMPQKLGMQCEALAAAQLRSASVRRRSSRSLLLGTIFIVAAAAAVLITRMIPSDTVALGGKAGVGAATDATAGAGAEIAPAAALVPDGAVEPVTPVTVSLELVQKTEDAMGQTFGRQVYEHAREELRALPGVVLVDAGQHGAAMPAFRMTYSNNSKSGTDFFFRPDGLPAPTGRKSDELLFLPDLEFDVEGMPLQADIRGMCETRVGQQRIIQSCSGGEGHRIKYLGGSVQIPMPADCVGLRTDRCRTTAADIAALTVLQWRLWTTPPDRGLEERLHAMLQLSSPAQLRFMAFDRLIKYKKLRMDGRTLGAAADMILTLDDAALRAELVRASIRVGNGPELLHQAQALLLTEKPNGDRTAGFITRRYLVTLLADELRNEPTAQATLEQIAANDPHFDVREEAKRALGQGEQTN